MTEPEREFTEEELDAQIALVEEKLAGRKLDLYKPYPKQELFHRLGGELTVTDRLLMAGNQAIVRGGLVATPRGFVPIESLRILDSVIGANGKPTRVTRITYRGRVPIYDVKTWDGSTVRCADDHQWYVWKRREGWQTVTTLELSKINYAHAPSRPNLPVVAPVDFVKRALPIDPYVTGLLLGDGCLGCKETRNTNITYTSADDALVQAVKTEFRVIKSADPKRPYEYKLPGAQTRIREAGIFGKRSWEKSIPVDYLWSSVDDRLALLQGLMDTDGTVGKKEGGASFCSTSRALAEGVSALARSLGGNGKINFRLGSTSRGKTKPGRDFYVVAVKLPMQFNPFRLSRKAEKYSRRKNPTKTIHSVEYIGEDECFCITVEAADHLFVANDYVVTRNCGKTMSAAAETAFHLCGQYPEWWRGKRFQTAVRGWVGSPTTQTTRDAAQMLLMGPPGEFGTGLIPARYIVDYSKATHGVPNSLESVIVKHVSGKNSQLQFKSYDQGRLRWQAATLNFVWFDEEPPMDIFTEGRTRTNVPGNFTYMTFTPLLGMSDVVIRFLKEKPIGSIVVPMTIDDALHYSPEQRAAVIAGYPAHERKARAQGIPILGSGAVFPIEQEQIETMPFSIPDHWPRLCGMDFGWDHPTACVWIAWDRDTDTVFVYDTHRVKEQTPIVHAATMKAKGAWIPVAWPHDGLAHDKGSGAVLAQQYRNLGVNMMKEKATHKPEKGKKEGSGGFGVEAGISEILQRMQTGRFKVFSNLNDWFDEYRMYYRKDGLIVKEHDDLMSATRVGVMMLRFAKLRRQDTLATPKLPSFTPSYSSTGVLG